MTLYCFELEGEDHTLFSWEVEASSRDDAFTKLELIYPDARVVECNTAQYYRDLEEHRYEYIARMQDEGWDY